MVLNTIHITKNKLFITSLFVLFFLGTVNAQITLTLTADTNDICDGLDCRYNGPSILINEVMNSPALNSLGEQLDGSIWGNNPSNSMPCRGEWIELYNPDKCKSVDISCYFLGNNTNDDGLTSLGGGFTIPNGTIVPPMGFVLIRGLNAPAVPANLLIQNGGNTIELVVENIPNCISGGTRLWFPNAGGWFAFYDRNGVPQDAISWANLNNFDQNGAPCIPSGSCSPFTGPLVSYSSIPTARMTYITNTAVPSNYGMTFRRIPDGGSWVLNTASTPTYGDCNTICNPPLTPTCNGKTFVVVSGGTPPYTYIWDDTRASTADSATQLCAGTYCVTVTDANHVTKIGCVTVYDHVPTVIFNPVASLCENASSVNLSTYVSPQTTSFGVGTFHNPGITSSTFNPSTAGLGNHQYYYLYVDTNECRDSTFQTITVKPIPTSPFTTNPICAGDSCIVTYIGTPIAGATYNWNFNGATIISGTGQGPYIITWYAAAIYNITLTVTANGCTSTQTAQNVTVYDVGSQLCCTMPTPKAGADKTLCSLTTNLEGVASTPLPKSGIWTCVPPTANINTPTSPTTTVSVPIDGVYTFTWTESNSTYCTASDAVIITFNQQPVANAGVGGKTCSHSFNLTGIASVGTGIWTANPSTGVVFGNANSASTNVTVTNDGTYTFTWSENNNGCTSSDNVQVTFTNQPIANAGPDNALCASSYTLNAVSSFGTGTWTTLSGPGNVLFDDNHSPTANISVGINGIYTFVWTENNGNGCIDADTVVIQLSHTPNSPFTLSPIKCFGKSSTVNYTGNGNALCTYIWDWDGGTVSPGTGAGPHLISWLSPGTYSVSLTVSLNGCTSTTTTVSVTNPAELVSSVTHTDIPCNGELSGTVDLTVSGGTLPYQFAWSNADTTEDLSVVGAGNYTVLVTDFNYCTITNSATILEPAAFNVSTNASITICGNKPAYLTAHATGGTGPNYTYLWSTLETTSSITVYPKPPFSTYTIVATDQNNCTDSASVTIFVSPPIEVTLIPNTDSVCPGDPVMLTVVITGGVGPPYTIINQDGVVVSPPIYIYPEVSGYYSVYVKDDCGTSDTGMVYIFVYPLPPAAALADSLVGCQPFTVHFNEAHPLDGNSLVWNFGDNDDFSLAQNPVHTYTQSGTFTVTLTVTSKWGCKNIVKYDNMITVYPKPIAQFVWTPEFASIMMPIISFTNMSTNGFRYIWSFGDGDFSSIVHPVHRFPDAGSWPVQLIAITNMGCSDTVIYPIVIQDEYTFYAPTAFSPDFDQQNDSFFAFAHGIKETGFYLAVFDRWGEIIWETDKYSEITEQSDKWDGCAKNHEIVPIGTYTWLAIFKDFKDIQHEKTGAITVIR